MHEILVSTLRFVERRPAAFDRLHADLADRLPEGPIEASPRYPSRDPREVVLRVDRRSAERLERFIAELCARHDIELRGRDDLVFQWRPDDADR
jgi:hypothetical protein